MKGEKNIIVVGGFHEVLELCERCSHHIVGIIDPGLHGTYLGYDILGHDGDAARLYREYGHIPLVVSPDTPGKRCALIKHYADIGFDFATLIHPSALVSGRATIGKGVVIQANVHISANAKLADFVRVNVYANLMHDVLVERYTTIAPNAVLLGSVVVKEACYVGANATILPHVKVGARAVVGAGAVVVTDVEPDCTVAGNPARVIKRHARDEDENA